LSLDGSLRPSGRNPTYVNRLWQIFDEARLRNSGLAQRARLVMSHSTGKIEILGQHAGQTISRYQRAADPEDEGRFLTFPSNPDATRFDDYLPNATVQ